MERDRTREVMLEAGSWELGPGFRVLDVIGAIE
jgi:hypothetical protein